MSLYQNLSRKSIVFTVGLVVQRGVTLLGMQAMHNRRSLFDNIRRKVNCEIFSIDTFWFGRYHDERGTSTGSAITSCDRQRLENNRFFFYLTTLGAKD
jgi:hypothetical protein